MGKPSEVLKSYGKSFYWAGKFLPIQNFNKAAELYMFCRKLDDIADKQPNKNTLIILKEIKQAIKNKKFESLQKYDLRFPTFLLNNNLVILVITDLIDGLIFDQGNVQIKDVNELLNYSYKVAGTVGILMCIALDCYDKKAYKFAVDYGISMQITNIMRDISEDAEINRCYLPMSLTNNLAFSDIYFLQTNFDNKIEHKLIIDTLKELNNLSEKFYLSGKKGFYYLPFKTRIGIAVAGAVYREIRVILKRRSYNWYMGRVKTNFFQKLKVTIPNILLQVFKPYYKLPQFDNKMHDNLKYFLNE